MDEELLRLSERVSSAGQASLAADVSAFARGSLEHDRWVESVAGRFIVAMARELRPVLERVSDASFASMVASLFPIVEALRARWPREVMSAPCSSGASTALAPREVAEAIDVLEGRVTRRRHGGAGEAFVGGLIEGSFDDVGYADGGAELARIAGSTISGLFAIGDVRDAVAEGRRGNTWGVAWNLFGAIPVAGDIGKGIRAGAEGVDALRDAAKAAERIRGAARLLAESETIAGGARRGHTLGKHVGQTVRELEARLARSTRATVSTFATKDDAAWFVSETLSRRSDDIRDWMRAPDQSRLVLHQTFAETTGIALHRASLDVEDVHGLRLTLVKDASARGYFVVSAFPQP
jgi:hypothetical protein